MFDLDYWLLFYFAIVNSGAPNDGFLLKTMLEQDSSQRF